MHRTTGSSHRHNPLAGRADQFKSEDVRSDNHAAYYGTCIVDGVCRRGAGLGTGDCGECLVLSVVDETEPLSAADNLAYIVQSIRNVALAPG